MYFNLQIAKELKIKCQDLSGAALGRILNHLGGIIVNALEKKGVFRINNIGKLYVAVRNERDGVNPRTGARIKIPTKKVVKFKMAKSLKQYFN